MHLAPAAATGFIAQSAGSCNGTAFLPGEPARKLPPNWSRAGRRNRRHRVAGTQPLAAIAGYNGKALNGLDAGLPFGEAVMPLLDHFHPPLLGQRHWEGFHGWWAAAIAGSLNDHLLPPEYFAEFQV